MTLLDLPLGVVDTIESRHAYALWGGEIPDTATLLTAVEDKEIKRRGVAALYAVALRYGHAVPRPSHAVSDEWDIDWKTVNRAILNRWSMSGLKWIKRRAWRAILESGE